MFRKYYKAANDDIKPKRELIDEIFEKKQTVKPTKKVFRFRPGYGTAIAAALVIVMGIAALPQINPVTEKPLEQSIQPRQIEAAEIKKPETVAEKPADAPIEQKDVQQPAVTTETDTESPPSMARMTPPTDAACEFMITEISEVTEDEQKSIENSLRQKFGEADAETGNPFIFEIAGKSEFGGETVYVGRWRWWVKDHSSLLCEFVLNEQITEMYECSPVGEDGLVQWTKTNNLLD